MEIKQNDFKTAYYNLLSKYAELEAQIEKMKCCENCKHHDIEDYTCNIICSISGCNKNSKWELEE